MAPPPRAIGAPRDSNVLALVLGIAGAVLVCVAIFVVLVLAMLRRSEPYQKVATLIRDDEGIRTVVGPDPKLGFWVTGSVKTSSGGGGTAALVIPVSGSAGSTRVQAALRRKADRWTVLRAIYHDASGTARSLGGITPPSEPDRAGSAHAPPSAGFSEAEAHYAKAYELHEKKDFAAAMAEYDRALDLDPSSAAARHGRGLAAIQLGDDERALADFRELIRLEPSKIEGYLLLDQVLTRRQAWDEIIDAWTTLIASQPQNARAYLERGGAYYRKKEMPNAQADAEKACALGNQQGCDIGRRFTGR